MPLPKDHWIHAALAKEKKRLGNKKPVAAKAAMPSGIPAAPGAPVMPSKMPPGKGAC